MSYNELANNLSFNILLTGIATLLIVVSYQLVQNNKRTKKLTR
jgi:hypothetical protein